MKKTFLIAGLIAGLTATNGYAVGSQTVVVTYTCPAGCELNQFIRSDGTISAWCTCEYGQAEPRISIKDLAPSPSKIQEVMNQSMLNQAAIKNAKKTKLTSVRAVAIPPKMVKKVVYEEIISNDDAE